MRKTVLIILLCLIAINVSFTRSYFGYYKFLRNQFNKGVTYWNNYWHKKFKDFNPRRYPHPLRRLQIQNKNLDRIILSNMIIEWGMFKNSKIRYANLKNSEFSGTQLINCDFRFSNLYMASFSSSILKKCFFYKNNFAKGYLQSKISDTRFISCNMSEMKFCISKFKNVNFSNSILKKSVIDYCNKFTNCNFRNVDFKNSRFIYTRKYRSEKLKTIFQDCSFHNTDFRNIKTLNNVLFKNCDFKNAKVNKNWFDFLKKQKVKNFNAIKWYPKIFIKKLKPTAKTLSYIKILQKGASFWNKWREKNRHRRIVFKSKVVIKDINLDKAKFINVDFRLVKFINCKLNKTLFYNCRVYWTKFINCKLNKAIFKKSVLRYVDFKNCIMNSITFKHLTVNTQEIRFIKSTINKSRFIGPTANKFYIYFTDSVLTSSDFIKYTNYIDFSGSKLNKTKFFGCFVSFSKKNIDVDFSNCIFKNTKMGLNIINKSSFKNSKFVNVYFEYPYFIRCNFKNSLFSNSSIVGGSFIDCDLTNTTFRRVYIKKHRSSSKPTTIDKKWYAHLKKQRIRGFHRIKWK